MAAGQTPVALVRFPVSVHLDSLRQACACSHFGSWHHQHAFVLSVCMVFAVTQTSSEQVIAIFGLAAHCPAIRPTCCTCCCSCPCAAITCSTPTAPANGGLSNCTGAAPFAVGAECAV